MSKGESMDFGSCSVRGANDNDLTQGGLVLEELRGRRKLWFNDIPTG